MIKKILLNNQAFAFSPSDLPILIHGAHKKGSSLFTVSLISQLYSNGSKILFFSGYEMAKEEFTSQVENVDEEKVAMIKTGKEEDLVNTIRNTADIDERILLVKNVELLSEKSFDHFKDNASLIVSGDIEKCPFKNDLLQIPFQTVILFSPLSDYERTMPEDLDQYEGFMWGHNEGVVTIQS